MLEIQATNLPRVVACNGSLSLAGQIDEPASEQSTDDAREGTAAHQVFAATISGLISSPFDYIDKQMPNGVIVTLEMAEFVAEATNIINDRIRNNAGVHFLVETNVDYQPVPGVMIRSRSDCITWQESTGTLHIDDFKYGFRLVEVEENLTLLAYAIGVCAKHGWQPTNVILTIHQPRRHHPDGKSRPWPLTVSELLTWQGFIADALRTLRDELSTGPHCYKCPALGYCPAAREAAMNGVDVTHSIAIREDMTDDVLSFELEMLTRAEDAIKLRLDAIREIGKYRINKGSVVPNWAVEVALGNRKFLPGTTPEMLSIFTGLPLDKITTTKLISPAQLEKAGASEAVVNALVTRPTTGVRLVRQNANKRGKKLFGG